MEETLIDILHDMQVPIMRKVLTDTNLLWLKRNLLVYNMKHKDYPTAIHLINTLLVMKGLNG